ncbi:hypothetical protein F5Y00DRAFT_273339 [Daldinia vernicosa]|uniref:uncharacterized protein n=1 Tax=Daldinia vernicosa TaxID=114800 RepID=UPI002008D82B|nr:uncharacterized protein F5Y00DRAFT_273339 [Daldinia vernicosa]KAI0845079.1 hypothetical protein F5Y00DRAFT_273339 [Daldinia vernicosa]
MGSARGTKPEKEAKVIVAERLRKEAKAIADDRRKYKEKHRLMQGWVYDKYKPSTAGSDKEVQLDAFDEETSTENAVISTRPAEGSVWHLPTSSNGRQGPRDLTLGTMLEAAERCYQISKNDFDTMSLCDHIHHIQEVLQPDNSPTPVSEALVTQPLVVLAQHQLYLAKKDYKACVARIALHSSLPESVKRNIKTCQDCYDRFRPDIKSCSCAKKKQTCLHGPCRYHPGNIKCWGEDTGMKNYLEEKKVTAKEFNLWIHMCYWDCCGAKLVTVDPSTARRSQKKKKIPLEKWEIANDIDGSVGCKTRDHHVAIQ